MRKSARHIWHRGHRSSGAFFRRNARAEQPFFGLSDATSDAEREADRVAEMALQSKPQRAAIRATPQGPAAKPRQGVGRPLSASEKRWFQPRLGADLSTIRLHDDAEAGKNAKAMQARAFAHGNDISLAPGAYQPDTSKGRRLLGHELAHSVQQARTGRKAVQRNLEPEVAAPAASPADLPASGRWHVVVIGSPGPGEHRAGHADQFIRAGERHPFSSLDSPLRTVWLVERTGHALAGLSEAQIRARGPRHVFFIDAGHSLTSLLNAFPPGSIGQLDAYSHGTPGLMALRYGWPGLANYGLSLSQARSLTPLPFAASATLSFDSCNSGTDDDDEVSLSQTVADATQRPTQGWTGRTSYRLANSERWPEDRHVVASEIMPAGGSFDTGELGSQLIGRHPQEVTFTPRTSPGSFQSTFDITARLPESRRFPVRAGSSVHVTLLPEPEHPGAAGRSFHVILWREDGWSDDNNGGSRRIALGDTETLRWSHLAAGTYWIELYHLHGIHVRGPIWVEVRP